MTRTAETGERQMPERHDNDRSDCPKRDAEHLAAALLPETTLIALAACPTGSQNPRGVIDVLRDAAAASGIPLTLNETDCCAPTPAESRYSVRLDPADRPTPCVQPADGTTCWVAQRTAAMQIGDHAIDIMRRHRCEPALAALRACRDIADGHCRDD